MDEQTRTSAADVALVKEDAVNDAFDHLVNRRVVEDNVGSLATQLQREALVARGGALLDEPTYFGRASKGNLVHAGVVNERRTGHAVTGQDVHDSVG